MEQAGKHKRIRLMKLARAARKGNSCWKYQCHLEICLSFPIEAIVAIKFVGRKLPTVSWWSVRSWALYVQIHANLAQQGNKSLWKADANHLSSFQSISGSKAMHWKLQRVKCMDKHMERQFGRKSRALEKKSKKGFNCSKRMSILAVWREWS